MQLLVWFRYIDDIFSKSNHSEDELNKFLENLNKFKSNLKSTNEITKDNIIFLDLNVSTRESDLITDLYFKENDFHYYLHHQSSHPDHMKKLIVYSQALRLERNCTIEKDLNQHLVIMKEWFFARVYPEKMVKEQMKQVVFGKTDKTRDDSIKGVLFIVTFRPKLMFLVKKIKSSLNICIYI